MTASSAAPDTTAATGGAVRWKPIAGAPFGIEVDWRTASRPTPSEAEAAELRMLLAVHHLLLVRGGVTTEEQLGLVGCFGRIVPQGPRVEVNEARRGPFPIVAYVSNRRPEGILGNTELVFHHDLAHVATPVGGISLYAEEVVEGEAATLFANGELAYRSLAPELQDRIDRFQAVFVGNFTPDGLSSYARQNRYRLDPTWPRAVHPVVVPHPLTAERCLYVNQMQAVQILGLPEAEGDALLEELLAAVYRPEHVYEHRWHQDDLVLWDNLVVQHARRPTDERSPRTLRRVVFGEKSTWEEWPQQVDLDIDVLAPDLQ
jgi:alpha-ketoglutarate-dependent taurine dioxygenase